MPGLMLQNQKQRKPPLVAHGLGGMWFLPIILIIVCIAIITLYGRLDGGGAFAAMRSAVQSVTKPIETACTSISPLASSAEIDSSELGALQKENAQLKALVSELEEYRDQDQRLAALLELEDAYKLKTTSATVTSVSSDWTHTATINKGSSDGIQVGMGVISAYGLYGQIESVTESSSTVRLITDSNSSVAAYVQGSHAKGILQGSYDGEIVLEYISTERSVGEGDYVLTSGEGGVYPQGIIIGVIKSVEVDSSKLYYRIGVDTLLDIEACKEALVLTGDEGEVTNLVDDDLLDSIVSSSTSAVNTSSEEDSEAETDADSEADSASSSDESSDTQSSAQAQKDSLSQDSGKEDN